MNRIHELIETLRKRSDVGVADETHSWRVYITKGPDLGCEVTIPRNVLEWHASVKHRRDQKEVWSDWMDYTGYDDQSMEQLETSMARDILAFIDRVSIKVPLLPLQIYEEGRS